MNNIEAWMLIKCDMMYTVIHAHTLCMMQHFNKNLTFMFMMWAVSILDFRMLNFHEKDCKEMLLDWDDCQMH